jgi:hypothetical protein
MMEAEQRWRGQQALHHDTVGLSVEQNSCDINDNRADHLSRSKNMG